MAVLNTQYHSASDDELYSDGAVEAELLERVLHHDSTLATDSRWEVFYHFSPLRENILNWYPFAEHASILEIGSGCGALTGLLARCAGSVTSCELTLPRAKINFQRHKDIENLEIIVGDFSRLPLSNHYDYIVINGVFEYAASIMGAQQESPFLAFLQRAKSLLRPSGKILLAIENRLGLKYFSGAPEDHLGTFFTGLNGYGTAESVRTFSKGELADLAQQSGLCVQQWYYPFPDYKFPVEIFTDSSVNHMVPSPSAADYPYDLPRVALFDARNVHKSLMKDNLAGYFSNSFLVELANAPDMDDLDISYVKISNNRKKCFGISTTICSNLKKVYKKPLYPEGVSHLEAMAAVPSISSSISTIPSQFVDGALVCDLVPQESLQSRLERAAQANAISDIWADLNFLKFALYQDDTRVCTPCSEFRDVFGLACCTEAFHWKRNINIDLTAENIFCEADKWLVIDNEWVFPFLIPAEYALWRTLTQQQDNPHLAHVLTTDAICDFLGITSAAVSIFRQWEAHFSGVYVGIRDLSVLRKPVYPINLNEVIAQKQAQSIVTSQLFLFFQDHSYRVLTCQAELAEDSIHLCVTFSSKEIPLAESIRWDPVEGVACRISDILIDGFSVAAINAEVGEPEYTFATFDPQMQLLGDWSKSECIQIKFRCQPLDWTTGYLKREQERDEAVARSAEATAAQLQYQAQNRELQLGMETLRAQQSDTAERLLRSEQQFAVLQEQHTTLQDQHAALQDQHAALQDQHAILQGQHAALQGQHTTLQEQMTQLASALETITTHLDEVSNQLRDKECVYQETSGELQRVLLEVRKHRLKSAAKIIRGKDI